MAGSPTESNPAPAGAPAYRRVIGRLVGDLPGPTLVVVAGMHGNEPAGVVAAERVVARLAGLGYRVAGAAAGAGAGSAAGGGAAPGIPAVGIPAVGVPARRAAGNGEGPVCRGEVILLTGNITALTERRRFIDRDLNRQWLDERLAELDGFDAAALAECSSEDREMLALWREIAPALARARGSIYFVDLHTTSADGIPFSMIFPRPQHQAFALKFHLPIVLGLIDSLDGTLLKQMFEQGCVVLGVEGGQNDQPVSALHHEEVLWIALTATGILPPSVITELGLDLWRLEMSRGGLPRMLEIHSRHGITPEDRFEMQPGYLNIQRIKRDELLARDRNGEIRAPEDGLILMPLYQAQGDDGFFIGREIMA